MSKFLRKVMAVSMLLMASMTHAQQVSNANFEDWSGSFNGEPQAKGWNASNVEQVGMKFNFAHKETGRSGYCMMVQDQDVGAMGITETSPGYFSLGVPWAYLPSITAINQATAGTEGGISWTHRPDTMSVWIKRTGDNWAKEDFYLLYYSWSGTAKSNKYKGKNGGCTETNRTNEESDIRLLMNHNQCGTTTPAKQIAEGMWREKKEYGSWTNIRVPIYYMNDDVPTMMNIIFSASNYPNYRANSGLYTGNSLYVDDVEMIYSASIQKLFIDGVEWKGFNPNTSDVQYYPLGEDATSVPAVEAVRGAGKLTNASGETGTFPGRKLSGSEISISYGDLNNKPTVITVKSADNKKTSTFKIQFQKAASSNTKLAGINYVYKDKSGNDVIAAVADFNPTKTNYSVELPYGTTVAPVLVDTLIDKAEDKQKIALTQAGSVTGKATIVVTAPNGKATATYTLNFSIGKLADNTLKGIQINGKDLPGFTPNQTTYKVSLPVGTTAVPTIKAVSDYPAGEQTIEYVLPSADKLDGGQAQIKVTTPGNPTPKTYKLNFKLEASSYSYLKDLKAGDYITSFNPETFTYFVNLPLGTTSLPKITAVKGDEYQKEPEISSLGEGVVDGTVRITVTAANGDQSVYKIVFTTQKSSNSSLKGIQIGGTNLPGFDPNITAYVYALPVGTDKLPEITWTQGDEYQTVTLTTGGLNGKSRIMVTAGDGSTTIYQISFSVQTYSDNTLKALYLNGELIEGFAGDKDEYWYNMPQGTTERPTVTFELQNEDFQNAAVRDFTGLNGDYKITVRPQSGASRTYIIHFAVETSSNVKLKMLYIDGVPVKGFDPEVLNYTDSLPEGVSAIPNVTFDKDEATQRVLSILENRVQTITVTAESGAKRVYTITFIVTLSQNAFLENILIDSVGLNGFRKDSMNYTYPLSGERCPKIDVVKAPGQQVTITAPYGAGVATIKVQPEAGEANTYTITFEPVAAATARLKDIEINGQSIGNFEPTTMHYNNIEYSVSLPQVVGVKDYNEQKVQVNWKQDTAWIYVADTLGNKAAYSVAFVQKKMDNTNLKVFADGKEIIFDKNNEYTQHLTPGSSYPELTYQAGDATQVLFFGQTAEGVWGITVQTEKGTKATYTATFIIDPFNDATLANILLDDQQIKGFKPAKLEYEITIDEGASLPILTVEARARQDVILNNVSDSQQQIIVTAESGAVNTYLITYTRKQSSNALLADILINGKSIEGFSATKFNYVDTIAWRSKCIPNVFPVGQRDNQTITTYYSRPNGVTRIHVVAQDGSENNYWIAFPTRKSDNTRLGDLYLDTEENVRFRFSPDTLNYVVTLPYGLESCPMMVFEKEEDEQRVDLVSRPIGQTSQIIVTAENGDQRTYNILFKYETLKTANVLSMITIKETGLMLSDENTFDYDIDLPFGSRTMTVEYKKNYPAQTVFVQPGGVKYPTIIRVKANNGDVADAVYTLTPVVPTADPAVVTDIRVNDKTIPGFDPERFSYIVPVTTKPVLRYDVADGVRVNVLSQTSKHWEAEVTVGNRTNKYNVWFYYTNEQVPNMNFDEPFVACDTYTSAKKPKGWNTVADALGKHSVGLVLNFTPDQLVTESNLGSGNKGVHLQTIYSDPGGGAIPGFITLGKVKGTWGVAGSTSFGISGGIKFHNSPDVFSLRYNLKTVRYNNLVTYELIGMDGVATGEWKETETTGSNYKTYTYSLADVNAEAGEPVMLNITICSYHQVDGTITATTTPDMTLDWISFAYNHTLTSMTADGLNASKSGNAFSVDLKDAARIEKPVLRFTGEVADQAQLITWKAPTKDKQFETRKADIRNYAENGTDYTDYTLSIRRPLDSVNVLSSIKIDGAALAGFAANTTDYTIVLNASRTTIPDVMPVPGSSLQKVETEYNANDSIMTITVTPEKTTVAPTVYKIKFSTKSSNDVTLENIVAEGLNFDADKKEYELEAAYWPIINVVKKSDKQVVTLNKGLITVIAEDGTQGSYTISLKTPQIAPNGEIKEFSLGTNVITDFGGDKDKYNAARPKNTYVDFERTVSTDSVIFVQHVAGMTWSVPNTNKTYIWNYPSDDSDNSLLKQILLNNANYDDFRPELSNDPYEIKSDTALLIEAVAAEEKQHIVTSQAIIDSETEKGIEYTIEVTAANGQATRTYKVRVLRPMSDIATLKGIYLDSVLVEHFEPTNLYYNVVLPLPADGVKRAQPQIPNISYEVGDKGQTVKLTPGELGSATTFYVVSEDGTLNNTYELTIEAEKSRCVDLTGITVNGVPVDQFEPGRHYYSQSLKVNDIEVDYTTDDRFQTVTTQVETVEAEREYRYTLYVTAEDDAYTAQYEVMIYVENQSNDAQLANILLDGKNFVDFERALNEDLVFDGGNNNYEINLPSGTTVLPEVSAQLKMDGQHVEIVQKKDSILLNVTAMDGTPNQYVLKFVVPLSKNADLSMIFLDGDEMPDFEPGYYFYQVNLPVGVHKMPEVAAQKGEASQTLKPIEYDQDKLQATIRVQAEDPKTRENTYVVVFHITQSNADKLDMIYEDGLPLEGFRPDSMYYTKSLKVGTTAFPDLAWQEMDDWQTITMETVESTDNTLVRQIFVTAESGKKNTYTVSYTILKSTVDTLQAIFVAQKQLTDFEAFKEEYRYTLTAAEATELNGKLPAVDYITGDEYQTVMISQAPDSLESKSLGYKTLITVTAASGKTRTYTIHYPVEKSGDATLNMIMLSGKPIVGFDSERTTYRLTVDAGADLPLVSVVKKEEVQVYDIRFSGDSIYVDVTAENGSLLTYGLYFERLLSPNANLKEIFVEGHDELRFRSDEYDYLVSLPYGEDTIPAITWVLMDSLQTVPQGVQMDTLENGSVLALITVIAPNGEDEANYTLTFKFEKNNDNKLLSLYVDTTLVEGFDSRITEYEYKHPFGSDSTAFFGIDLIHYELSDSLAVDSLYMDENGTIYISVTAQNGNENIYTLTQTIALDSDNALRALLIAGDSVRGFDPDITFYTYYVKEGTTPPELEAYPRSENAEEPTWREVSAGDTCVITVTAQDKSTRKYYVHFAISPLNDALTPSPNDVLIKRIPGTMQIFVGTIRQGVTFGLYDQNGTPFFRNPIKIEPADANDADIIIDADELERLNDIYHTRSGVLIDLMPNQIYIYGFYCDNGKKSIKSGKLKIVP